MSEYAVLPLADYVDACEATREMTGESEKIPSGQLGPKIRSIDTQEDLSAEMTAQDVLIEDIMEALQGKAAGGEAAEIPTCTISLTGSADVMPGAVSYVTVGEDGAVVFKTDALPITESYTIPGCVCGTLFAWEGYTSDRTYANCESVQYKGSQGYVHEVVGLLAGSGETAEIVFSI